ncbi:hypothetical protein D3C80_1649800 [compost metagenome]
MNIVLNEKLLGQLKRQMWEHLGQIRGPTLSQLLNKYVHLVQEEINRNTSQTTAIHHLAKHLHGLMEAIRGIIFVQVLIVFTQTYNEQYSTKLPLPEHCHPLLSLTPMRSHQNHI